MAERRMFAKTIIDSDAFLDMPLSTQALYFHLSMRADDDGFINNPKKIQRMVGCGDDDLKLLIAKNFIIPFESGIVVIKHWKIHNYIQKDRYKETVYQEEKALLALKDNKSYTLELTPQIEQKAECIQNVYTLETQDRLGKDRVRDSIGKDREIVNYQLVADMYNDTCVSFPRVTKLSDKRKRAIKARLKTYSMDDFKTLFQKAEGSSFLKGSNGRNWSANFDWLIEDGNMAKVLDGNYDDRAKKPTAPKNGFNSFKGQRNYDFETLEKELFDNKPEPKTAGEDEEIRARAEALRQQLGGV